MAVLTTLTLIWSGTYSSGAESPPPNGSGCVRNTQSGLYGGTAGVMLNGVCKASNQSGEGAPGPPTQTILCGRPSSQANSLWDPRCGAPRFCFDTVTDPGKKRPEDAYATLVQSGAAWVLQSVWCPATAQPIPTTQALREQALRLLPQIQIGSAWAHRAIVNAQTILWATTDANRTLPTATVVGRRVHLRITLDHANWNFGDGTTDTTTDPGKPYDKANDPCPGAVCPDYYGHTYSARGTVTVTLTVAWHAEFSLDNGATWTAVDPAPLTGPATTHQLDLVQERGVLVPDP